MSAEALGHAFRLVTGSEDFTAKIWDVDSGRLLVDLTDVISWRRDDGRLQWPIPPRELTLIGCERLRALAGVRDAHGLVVAEAAHICDPLLDGSP